MELTPEQIQEKIQALTIQLQSFIQTEQAEINQMNAQTQQRLRSAQKHADRMEGKIDTYREMLPPGTDLALPLTPAPLTDAPAGEEAA